MVKDNRFHLCVRRAGGRLLMVALLGFGYVVPAYAYLDPGTGSILLQGLLAGIAATVAAGGVFWQRIKSAVSSLFSPSRSTDVDTAQKPDQ